MSEINPEDFPKFQIPHSLIEKLYEFTGNTNEQTKGFLLAYTDQEGMPMIFCKAGSQIIEMGIRKALEQYLIEIENADSPFDVNGNQE